MGAVFNVAIASCSQPEFLAFAGNWPGHILGTALPASTDYRTVAYDGPLIVMMGNEQAGLPDSLMQVCTAHPYADAGPVRFAQPCGGNRCDTL